MIARRGRLGKLFDGSSANDIVPANRLRTMVREYSFFEVRNGATSGFGETDKATEWSM